MYGRDYTLVFKIVELISDSVFLPLLVPVGVRQTSPLSQEQLPVRRVSQPLVISKHHQELGMENRPQSLGCPMMISGN
jgi:hypothetical protein